MRKRDLYIAAAALLAAVILCVAVLSGGGRHMIKDELTAAVEAAKTETRTALQTLYDALNQGQQKKLVKNEKVKALFDLFGVKYD